MVDSLGVERAGLAHQTMDFVSLVKQEFCKEGPVLACYARD